MKYRTHWNLSEGSQLDSEEAKEYTSEQIVSLACKLKERSDVIYTYHPNYMQLGARVAVWGLSPQKVCIDVQYSSFAAIKEIDINQLKSVFENYEAIVKSPKDYGFKIEQ